MHDFVLKHYILGSIPSQAFFLTKWSCIWRPGMRTCCTFVSLYILLKTLYVLGALISVVYRISCNLFLCFFPPIFSRCSALSFLSYSAFKPKFRFENDHVNRNSFLLKWCCYWLFYFGFQNSASGGSWSSTLSDRKHMIYKNIHAAS